MHKADQEPGGTPPPAEYIKAARAHLRSGNQKQAYRVLLQAVVDHPDNALILSYYGCLQAIVDKKFRSGIDTCRKALATFKPADTYSAGVIYPILHLNLGRAYLAAGRKQDAVDSFTKGVKYDKANSELNKELRMLGLRKRPLIPFLSRSNPINKYIGMLLHEKKGNGKQRQGRK